MFFAHLACQTFDDKFDKKPGIIPRTRNAIFGGGVGFPSPSNLDSSAKLTLGQSNLNEIELNKEENSKPPIKVLGKKNITSLAEMLGFKHLQKKQLLSSGGENTLSEGKGDNNS